MSTLKAVSSLAEFLTPNEIAEFKKPVGIKRPHPLNPLLTREDGRSLHAVNTERALTQVSLANMDWLNEMRVRIVSSDLQDSAAALSELRAYGALLEAGFTVTPVPTDPKLRTPDFVVSDGADSAEVEVHAKHFYELTENELQAHRKWVSEQPRIPGVASYVHVVQPFGKPVPGKPNDATTTNAISRICAIKQSEKQFGGHKPTVLWMDFQDLYSLDMSMTVEQFQPVISWNEHLTSGALWYAFLRLERCPCF